MCYTNGADTNSVRQFPPQTLSRYSLHRSNRRDVNRTTNISKILESKFTFYTMFSRQIVFGKIYINHK